MHATTFAALGEPSRLHIIERLRQRPFTVGELADILGIRQPQVSKHLKVLREAGLVTVEADARRRIYHLHSARFAEIADWAESFEHLWEHRLDALGTYLKSTDTPQEGVE